MPQNQSNNSDTIVIRRPDGTFVTVAVADQLNQTSAADQPMPKPPVQRTENVQSKTDSKPDIVQTDENPQPEPESNTDTQGGDQMHEKVASTPPQQSQVQPKSNVASTEIQWDHEVAEVIASLQLAVNDPVLVNRLQSIVLSRLRDVRDWLQTKEALTKNVSSGGLGLSEAEAAEVLNKIESRYQVVHSHNEKQNSSIPQQAVEDVYAPSAELTALTESDLPVPARDGYKDLLAKYLDGGAVGDAILNEVQTPTGLNNSASSKPSVEEVAFEQPSPPPLPKPRPTPPKPATQPAPKPPKQPTTPAPAPEPPVPSMQDVKAKKRLMSPVDELQQMRLADFRRLGSSTTERLKSINETLEELGDESFSKRVEGIKAWRSNPLYLAYIKIGDMSLGSGKSVEQVIADLQEQGQETFTLEEFEQLTDFNKALRY